MTEYTFIVHGIPYAQPRARAVSFGGHARMYQPRTPCDAWKAAVAAEAARVIPARLAGAVRVTLVFALPRPRGHLRKNGEPRPSAPRAHASKPDLDNLAKAAMDALKGIAWDDDAQVQELTVRKCYAIGADRVGAHVAVASST